LYELSIDDLACLFEKHIGLALKVPILGIDGLKA
jgi:hypothetical protein